MAYNPYIHKRRPPGNERERTTVTKVRRGTTNATQPLAYTREGPHGIKMAIE